MSLGQATAAPPSTGAGDGTRSEEDEGRRNHQDDFQDPQRALAELADAAQCWELQDHRLPEEVVERLKPLFVRLEVGIQREISLSDQKRPEIETPPKTEDANNGIGPVASGQCNGIPVFTFRELVSDELIRRYPGFVEAYRRPHLCSIQTEAKSVLAREQVN